MFDGIKNKIEDFNDWFEDFQNRSVAIVIAVVVGLLTLIACVSVYAMGRILYYGLTSQTTLTIAKDNPCITPNGLVRRYAPSNCYEDKQAHVVPQRAVSVEPVTPQRHDNTYEPPCFKPGCSDKITGKRMVEGEVYTTEFIDDKTNDAGDHLQPDYTNVSFLALHDDEERPDDERFCGNVLDKFTPGQRVRMVINESKQAEYNGCYTIEAVQLTFGGEPLHKRR